MTPCSICGQKALYRVNDKAFCVNHKEEAQTAQFKQFRRVAAKWDAFEQKEREFKDKRYQKHYLARRNKNCLICKEPTDGTLYCEHHKQVNKLAKANRGI